MEKKMNNDYLYFVGKYVTVITNHPSISLKDPVQYAEYFSGFCDEITVNGIWLKHHKIKTRAFFNNVNIIGVIEEQFVPEEKTVASLDDLKKIASRQNI